MRTVIGRVAQRGVFYLKQETTIRHRFSLDAFKTGNAMPERLKNFG
jgi:hypothetical protein